MTMSIRVVRQHRPTSRLLTCPDPAGGLITDRAGRQWTAEPVEKLYNSPGATLTFFAKPLNPFNNPRVAWGLHNGKQVIEADCQ